MNLVTPEASKVRAASMLLPASEVISGVCVCARACVHTHAHSTPHSLHYILSGGHFPKKAFQEALTSHIVAQLPPPSSIRCWPFKVSVQHLHSHSMLLPAEKGCPTHPPTKPQGGTALPPFGCRRDPSCTLQASEAVWRQPTCRSLFSLLQMGSLFVTIISSHQKLSPE